MEIIKDISAIIGVMISFITLVTLCTKGGRKFVKSFFERHTESIQEINKKQGEDIEAIRTTLGNMEKQFAGMQKEFNAMEEVAKQQCRNILKTIYYSYYTEKKIPLYERKTADKTYEIYHNLFHGNSYASLLYEQICKWEIDTLSYHDLNEE